MTYMMTYIITFFRYSTFQYLYGRFFLFLPPLFLCLSLAACLEDAPETPAAMVSTAHPLATQAGLDMLKAGGNAIDAAIAAELMLSLVEPQSSGIGGGGFLLFWEKQRQRMTSYDGRETAPAQTRNDVFLTPEGKPQPFFEAVLGGQSVGVPSLLSMFALAHQEHGHLPWADLFAPAIRRARQGFPISPRLAWWIEKDSFLKKTAAFPLFFDDQGQPKKEGEIVRNIAFAETLEKIAGQGIEYFYKGQTAKNIIRAVGDKNNFSQKDMSGYQPKKKGESLSFLSAV